MQTKGVCNRCGSALDVFDMQQDFTLHKKIQYGSVYDGATVHLQLCCHCFDMLVDACAVDPATHGEIDT